MEPNTLLEELLVAHGLTVVPYQGWLTANGRPSALTTSVHRNEEWHPSLIQIDLRALTPDGRTLIESVTGIGADREAAVRSGVQALCASSLHVLLTTLWDVDSADQVTVETWETPVGPRRAVIGGLVQRGGPLALPALFPLVQDALMARAAGPLHWLRIFRSNGAKPTTEVLLDNADWPELREAVAGLSWPVVADYHSVRLFLTLSDPAAMGA